MLTTTLDPEKREALQLPEDGYHVVLANPPFAGKIDNDRVVDDVKVGNSKATEVLFLKYMMESLRPGGRCGVIVPEGLLFGSTGAHKEIRRQLIENNRVEAVMSLPGGGVPAVLRRQDVGAAVQEGRDDGAGAVPARRQRRVQARRQSRHADRVRMTCPDWRSGVPGA